MLINRPDICILGNIHCRTSFSTKYRKYIYTANLVIVGFDNHSKPRGVIGLGNHYKSRIVIGLTKVHFQESTRLSIPRGIGEGH